MQVYEEARRLQLEKAWADGWEAGSSYTGAVETMFGPQAAEAMEGNALEDNPYAIRKVKYTIAQFIGGEAFISTFTISEENAASWADNNQASIVFVENDKDLHGWDD